MESNTLEKTLRNLSEHPFVTEASKEKKAQAGKLVSDVYEKLRKFDDTLRMNIFPYGSVGVGMATTESDFDGVLLFEGENTSKQDIFTPFYMQGGRHYQDVRILRFSTILDESLERGIIDDVLNQVPSSLSYKAALKDLGDAAIVFSPAVETTYSENRTAVNKWRHQFVQKLVDDYPKEAKSIWAHIAKYMKQTFVNYEEQEVGDQEKRPLRVKKNIESTLRRRYGDDKKKIARAQQYIQDRRKNFVFPSLDEIKIELRID